MATINVSNSTELQDAITSANAGDTIVLAAGTYTQQLTINGKSDLTITAADGADVTLMAPSDLAVNGYNDHYGDNVRAVVAVTNSTNINFSHITVNGAYAGDTTGGSNGDELSGIAFLNSSGGADHVTVTNVGNSTGGGLFGLQHGSAILVDGSGLGSEPEVAITHSTLTNFQKTGALLIGANVTFTDNVVTGIGATDLTAQNGIQMGYGHGTFTGNTISGLGYTPATYASSGIILYNTTGAVTFDDNHVSGAPGGEFVGVDLSDVNQPVSVSNNWFDYVDYGIAAYTYDNSYGLDVSPTFAGNHFDHVGTNGLFFAPEYVATGGVFATTTPFNITGTTAADDISGSAGADSLDGGAGADTLAGLGGNDTYLHVDHSDTVIEGVGGGTDTIVADVTTTLGDNVENLTLIDAAVVVETFTEFDTGAIDNGEHGWTVYSPHDQGVVDLGGSHGKVLRMSSDPSSGDFGGPYSVALTKTAGESTTTADRTSQTISFDFAPVSAAADDFSRLEVDIGNSASNDRNNFMVIETTADGVRIAVAQPDINGDFGDSGTFPTDWTELASGLDATAWHHIDLKVQYVDGANNDVIEVWVDGTMVGTTTTFENYHDAVGGTHADNAQAYQTDKLIFRAGNNGQPSDGPDGQNQGFYFDNLTGSVDNDIDGTGNAENNVITGNSGANTLTGGDGDDSLTGGGGHDTLLGGTGIDTAVYTGHLGVADFSWNTGAGTWTVAADGGETLTGVEKVTDGDGHTYLLVGAGGFATLQAAVNAATAGDTIILTDGTFAGATIDKAVTIVGANHGIDGHGVRGAETVIDGTLTVTAASGNLVIDGVEVINNSTNAVHQDGITVTGAANVTIENSHLYTPGVNANFAPLNNNGWGDVAIYLATGATGTIVVDHNLIDGGGSGGFSGASWARALITETDASVLTVTNNTVSTNRSGLGFNGLSSNDTVSGNTFAGNGTAISTGINIDLSGIGANTLNGNYDDINVRKSYNGVTLDLSTWAVVDPGPDGYVKVLGTDFNDTFTGTAGKDFLTADASDNSDGLNFGAGSTYVDSNTLNGLAGDDILFGSQGADTLNGGANNDLLNGGGGADLMNGGTGDDTFVVDNTGDVVNESNGQGNDLIQSSVTYGLSGRYVETLTLTGSANIDATGNSLNNTLNGNSGNNLLNGSTGADTMSGNGGNDTYFVDNAGDTVSEGVGQGTDLVKAGVSFVLGADIENLTLTGGHDIDGTGNAAANTIIGNAGANQLNGGGGNDTLYGNEGNDRLDGGTGADKMIGGSGNDTYYVDDALDHVFENVGNVDNGGTDTVVASLSFNLGAYFENLILDGSALNGNGNELSNVLTGNAFDNKLDGKTGADLMAGGAGNDTYFVDNSGDQVSEQLVFGTDDGGSDKVYATVDFTLGAFIESLVLSGSDAINGTGNDLGNAIAGNDGNNRIKGAGGNDSLTGGNGVDYFVFSHFGAPNGVDQVQDFVSGTDRLVFTAADFGWTAGHVLTGAELTVGPAVGAGGQFVYNDTLHRLYWDANGSAAGGLTAIVTFNNAATPHVGDFVFE